MRPDGRPPAEQLPQRQPDDHQQRQRGEHRVEHVGAEDVIGEVVEHPQQQPPPHQHPGGSGDEPVKLRGGRQQRQGAALQGAVAAVDDQQVDEPRGQRQQGSGEPQQREQAQQRRGLGDGGVDEGGGEGIGGRPDRRGQPSGQPGEVEVDPQVEALLAGAAGDDLLGDPQGALHPVRALVSQQVPAQEHQDDVEGLDEEDEDLAGDVRQVPGLKLLEGAVLLRDQRGHVGDLRGGQQHRLQPDLPLRGDLVDPAEL